MKILKETVLSVVLVLAVLAVNAQAKIEFKATEFNFGSINEEGGVASSSFTFTNIGDAPLIINNVTASCGCTTPTWPKEPIAPGKTGEIKIGYNPKNRPGPFRKSVSVYSNTQPAISVLVITGDVARKPKTIGEEYPQPMGNLLFKNKFLSMGNIPNTQTKTAEIEFANATDKTVKAMVYRAPAHIKARFEPSDIPAGEKGKLIVDYDAAKINNYGYLTDKIYLSIDEKKDAGLTVTVAATIEEDFSALTPEQKENAPIALCENTVFDFGSIKEGQKVSNTFKLTNKGKSDLLIRNVRTSCGCTTSKNANIAKPGETIDFVVTFDSSGKKGRQNRSLTVISNDPNSPSINLRVIGNVEGN